MNCSSRIQAEEARQARGRLKIFFGASPGVGKTYTMLEAGREQAREGIDVLVGYIEPHVRPETQALVLGLDVLARKEVPYRGTKLIEFDLDAALARRPQLILVDELAHTNAPGLMHAKRWQDVMRLLEAGISVYTTMNVQHLESLKDVVAQITGISVAETVPDSVFEEADEVELVDLPADDLLERMREGKVYLPRPAERAIKNFFSKGNLIALRELALGKAGERVGARWRTTAAQHGVAGVWPVNERLLVCVGPSPYSARLVRATRRIAGRLKAPWVAVHVETPADPRLSQRDREQLAETMHLAEQLGGQTATISGHTSTDELIHYARQHNVTKIIVGKPNRPRWRDWLQGSLVYELTRKCGDIDVYVITGEPAEQCWPAPASGTHGVRRNGYLAAVATVALCTLVSWPLADGFNLAATNLIMVYLLGVIFIATRFGRGPSILASVLSVAAFDFFFIPPVLTFAVQDTQYVLTFGVMLVTALTISTLTSRIAFQAESARFRERRTASLYAISQQLAAARTLDQIAQAAVRHVAEAVDAKVALLVAAGDRQLTTLAVETGGFDPGTARSGRGPMGVGSRRSRRPRHRHAPRLRRVVPAAKGLAGRRGRVGTLAKHALEDARTRPLAPAGDLGRADRLGHRTRELGCRGRQNPRANGNRAPPQLAVERRLARLADPALGDHRRSQHVGRSGAIARSCRATRVA